MSRATERVAARVKPPYKLVTETFTGPSSYVAGGNVYNSTILKHIEKATCIQATSGWRGEVATGSVSGNAFKLAAWTGTAQPIPEVDLRGVNFTVLLEGL